MILVSSADDYLLGNHLIGPCSGGIRGLRTHAFYIPGIMFRMFLGHDIVAMENERFALNSSSGEFMHLRLLTEDSLFRNYVSMLKKSSASGKLARRRG